MTEPRLKLFVLPETLAICRLDKDAPIPEWALRDGFFSVTRTMDELSIVCAESRVPAEVRREDGWKALRVEGPLDFSLTGILALLTMPLAQEGISVFAISTYDTDYLLVKKGQLERAVEILTREGHQIQNASSELVGATGRSPVQS